MLWKVSSSKDAFKHYESPTHALLFAVRLSSIGDSPPTLSNNHKTPDAKVCTDTIDMFNGRRALNTTSHDTKTTRCSNSDAYGPNKQVARARHRA